MAEQREYERTHPFINYQVSLTQPNPTLLRPEVSSELMSVYLTKGVLATTAIEGNTLSEDEARRVIDHELKLPPSRDYLATEILNVLKAYNLVKDELMNDPDRQLSVDDLKEYNRLILDGLELEEDVIPGEIRQYSVTVGGGIYRAAPWQDCEYLLERLCEWLNGDVFTAPDDRPELAAPYAIIAAIMAHIYIAWIHPFGDGNGRTARLLELWVLLKAGFPAPATQLLSNHYNITRTDYYRQLNRASRTGDVATFLTYAARGFVDQLREQLDMIWQQQFADRWEQHVYQQFGEGKTESERRRLRLVIDLSRAGRPVRKNEMQLLTPKLAQMYGRKTEKTLTRDLNALRTMGLIQRTRAGYLPHDDVILGFMPQRNDGVLVVEDDLPPRRRPVRLGTPRRIVPPGEPEPKADSPTAEPERIPELV
jgi:Fic family protein